MILKIYSIKDQKVETFNTPFYAKTHGEAERNFITLTNDSKSTVNTFPQDFDLYYLGQYDDQTGKFEPLDTPHHLVKAEQLLNKPPMSLV